MNILSDLEYSLQVLNKKHLTKLNSISDSINNNNKEESKQERAKRLLDSIDIELIEEYVRGKKLQRIRSNMKNK